MDDLRFKENNISIKKQIFLEALEKSRGVITVVTEKINVGRSTYYHWLKTDSGFKKAANNILRSRVDHIEDKLLAKALEGDTRSLIYMLEHLSKKKVKKETVIHNYYHNDSNKKDDPKSFGMEDVIDEVMGRIYKKEERENNGESV